MKGANTPAALFCSHKCIPVCFLISFRLLSSSSCLISLAVPSHTLGPCCAPHSLFYHTSSTPHVWSLTAVSSACINLFYMQAQFRIGNRWKSKAMGRLCAVTQPLHMAQNAVPIAFSASVMRRAADSGRHRVQLSGFKPRQAAGEDAPCTPRLNRDCRQGDCATSGFTPRQRVLCISPGTTLALAPGDSGNR